MEIKVNEKGVLERMHITLQCLAEFEKVLNRFPHSLCLYFVFMLVRAENPLSHKYVVAKGIKVFSLRCVVMSRLTMSVTPS